MAKALPDPESGLVRAMGFRDVFLYFITAGVNLQWVATAAAAGASALTVWLLACATMSVPLAFCVVELASRYPEEGGVYVWSKRAFGDFAAFMTGWTYWTSNLPYFPGVLYFAAGNALYIAGGRFSHLSLSPAYFIAASLAGLLLGTVLNLVGLNVGKWLNNVGAIARWLAALLLVGVGADAFLRFGSATPMSRSSLAPGLHMSPADRGRSSGSVSHSGRGASQIGRTSPPRTATSSASMAKRPAIRVIQSGFGTASSSVNATMAARLSRTPTLRAIESPARASNVYLKCGWRWQ